MIMILKSRIFVKIITIGAILSAFISPINLIQAQPDCNSTNSPGGLPTPRTTWSQNATVYVSIDTNQFSSQEIQCIQAAFTAWNNASGASGNASGVTFQLHSNQNSSSQVSLSQSTPTSPAQITSQVAPTSTQPLYQINRAVPGYEHDYGETAAAQDPNASGKTALAVTNLDPGITDCTALKENISHEIGHTFKLNDCLGQNCNATTTTMSEGPACTGATNQFGKPTCTSSDLNRTNISKIGPSDCDNLKIQVIPPVYNPSTVTGTGGSTGGGNNGGNDPSCTTYTDCYAICTDTCNDVEFDPEYGCRSGYSTSCDGWYCVDNCY